MDRLVLKGWQYLFGVVAPVALVLLNLWFFRGNLVGVAPVTLWFLAVAGPLLLIASQWRQPASH